MASPTEIQLSGFEGPYSKAVSAKAEEKAEQAALSAIRDFVAAAEFLRSKDEQLVLMEDIYEVTRVIYDETFQMTLQARELGGLNDRANTTPGVFVTGYTSQENLKILKGGLEVWGSSHFLTIDPIDEEYALYKLDLPHGGYKMTTEMVSAPEYLHVYHKASYDEAGRVVQAAIIGDEEVGIRSILGIIGRIEAADGSLWQNPYTNPDGTSRLQAEDLLSE